jgi:hypothetical protein
MRAELSKSNIKNKKYKVVVTDGDTKKTINFGEARASDYTINKDPKRKANYLARHAPRENWTDPFTSGYWSRWILWNQTTIAASVRDLGKRFPSLEIVNKIT